jgi:alkylated DNA repair protein (DNA oxidative demethylase)
MSEYARDTPLPAGTSGNREGLRLLPHFLEEAAQAAVLEAVRGVVAAAPLYTPAMPRTGRPLSVRMTNCGPLGWVTSREEGYRYQATHPVTGRPWPPIPPCILAVWHAVADYRAPPEACLVNWYGPRAKLGLHVDSDEQHFDAPVVSVSLGDDAWFRIGGLARRDPTERVRLRSGDVVVIGGAARLIHHGIDRVLPGTGTLIGEPGRFNLTLRRVTSPPTR